MNDYQPNTDNAHDHTYPQQAEGLRRFEALIDDKVDCTRRPIAIGRRVAKLEAGAISGSRVAKLEKNAAEQARLIEELRRFCTDLVIRVAVLERARVSSDK